MTATLRLDNNVAMATNTIETTEELLDALCSTMTVSHKMKMGD
jgi:hypothetical protein